MSDPKPGNKTTEFKAVIAVGLYSLLAGLSINEGGIGYEQDKDAMELFAWVVTAYVGQRGVVKAAALLTSKPAADLSPGAVRAVLQQIVKGGE